jgi:hypothetical protein
MLGVRVSANTHYILVISSNRYLSTVIETPLIDCTFLRDPVSRCSGPFGKHVTTYLVPNTCKSAMATIDIQPNDERIITLPDCLPARWPFKRTLNPADAAVEPASNEWTSSFLDLGPKILTAAADSCSTRLVALAYPDISADTLRILADWMTTFFIFDDMSDKLDREDVRKLGDCVMDVLRYYIATPTN